MFGGRRFLGLFCWLSIVVGIASPSASFGGTETPVIGVAKERTGQEWNGQTGYTVQFRIRIENFGNVPLNAVQVVDDFAATFPPPAQVIGFLPLFTSILSGSGTLTPNPAFNGFSDKNMLIAGSSHLAPGAVGQINLIVTFDAHEHRGPLFNQVVGSGTSPLGVIVTDLSDSGLDPDPDGDGNPAEPGENDPTQIDLLLIASIGAAKRVVGFVDDNGDGTFTAHFALVIENFGVTDLEQISLRDNLLETFEAPVAIIAVTPPITTILEGSGNLVPDLAFNGQGATQELLVQASSTLAEGAVGQVSFAVTFQPNLATGPFHNRAFAFARSPDDFITTDQSDAGSNPDPDGDGNPNEPGENDETTFVLGGPATEVPVLDSRGLLLLAGLLLAAGFALLRRGS